MRIWTLSQEEGRDQRLVTFMKTYPDFISGLDDVSLSEVEIILHLIMPISTQQVMVIIFLDFVKAGYEDYYNRKRSMFLSVLLLYYPHKVKKNSRLPIWNQEFLRYMINKRKIKIDDMLTTYLERILKDQYLHHSQHEVTIRNMTNICKLIINLGATIPRKGFKTPWLFSKKIFYDMASLVSYLSVQRHLYPYLIELNEIYTLKQRSQFIGKYVRGFTIKNNPSHIECMWIQLPSPLFSKILRYITP